MSLKVNRTDHETQKALSHTIQSLFLVAFAFLTRKNISMSKRWTGVANASAHGSPDKEEWFCELQHHNSIRIRRRGAVENVDCTIYPSTRGEIGVPSCARRPALLSVQVAIHLQSHHKDVFTPRQRTQGGPASSSGTRSWTGQLTKPQWLLPPRLTSQSPTAWSHIREQAGG
jgi:hypothetical protein